jgi:hypothetical protein
MGGACRRTGFSYVGGRRFHWHVHRRRHSLARRLARSRRALGARMIIRVTVWCVVHTHPAREWDMGRVSAGGRGHLLHLRRRGTLPLAHRKQHAHLIALGGRIVHGPRKAMGARPAAHGPYSCPHCEAILRVIACIDRLAGAVGCSASRAPRTALLSAVHSWRTWI